MAKEYTYHKSHKAVYLGEKGENITMHFVTQLYQVGIYGIVNGDASMQGSYEPKQLVNMEKKLRKQLKEGKVLSLEFGTPITVTDESGLWKEVIKQ